MLSFTYFVEAKNTRLNTKDVKRIMKTTPTDEIESAITDVYNNILPELKKAKSELEKVIKKILGKKFRSSTKTLVGIKPLSSVVDKVKNRNKPLENMSDLVRGAILTDTSEDAEKIASDIERKFKAKLRDSEYKSRGSDPVLGYYGSYHMDLVINGFVAELQIMPKKLWQYKKAAHDIYNQTRSKPGGPDKFSQALSKKIFDLGNKKSYSTEELTFIEYLCHHEELMENFDPESYYIID